MNRYGYRYGFATLISSNFEDPERQWVRIGSGSTFNITYGSETLLAELAMGGF
jgi:hypothetical protein